MSSAPFRSPSTKETRDPLSGKLTPMLAQYHENKAQHPDVLLMFRLGDFYEMFGEDAKVASEILQITLTSRLVTRSHSVAPCDMAGNPRLT